MALNDDEILAAIKPALSDEEILRQINEPEMSMGESVVRGIGQGGTVGFGDEINAGVVALRKALTRQLVSKHYGNLPDELKASFSEDYKRARDKERARNTESFEQNPWTHGSAELATGLAQGFGGLAAIKETGKQTLKQIAPRLAAVGAAEGGIYSLGASEGDTWGEIAGDTAEGAAYGATGAVAIPTAMQNVGRIYQKLVKTRGQRVADMVISDLLKAGYTPEEAAKYLEDNPAMILGDLGENLRWRTADVTTSPGQGAEDLKTLLLDRSQSQLDDRVEPFFRASLGGNANEGFETTLSNAQKLLSEKARPLYDEAYQNPILVNDTIKSILETPAGQEAMADAAVKAANDNVAFGPATSTRTLDYVARSLNDMASSATDNLGRATDKSTQFSKLRHTLLEEVRAQNPAFREAQSIYSDEKSIQNAFMEGVKALNGNTLVKVDRIKALPEAEKVALRSGLFQGVLEKMGGKPDTADVTRMFKQPNVRKVLKAAFDDEGQFAAFEDLMKKEGIMAETTQAALYGSRTKPLTSFGEDAQAAAETFMSGDPLTMATRYAMKKGLEMRGEAFRNDLAPLLGASSKDNLVELLVKQQERKPYQVTQTIQKFTGS